MTIVGRNLSRVNPERQMEIVREYIRGNNSQDNVVAIARFAIKNAGSPMVDENVDIGRTYTKKELSEMESRLDRLEMLVIRKRAGEIISPEEIDRAGIQKEEIPKSVPPLPNVKKEKPDDTKEIDDKNIEIDEIVLKINGKIDYAEILLESKKEKTKDSKQVAKNELELAIELVEQAESDEIDVNAQKNRLFDLVQKYAKVLESI